MRTSARRFLAQPEVVDEDLLRLLLAVLLAAGGLFFFRQRALPELAAAAAGAALALGVLWAGFHRLGLRALGGYWPGGARGAWMALLVFCLLPPEIPLLLAALLAALAVIVEGVERRALVPLALSGVTVAWLMAWLWQARAGSPYIAPFDFHALDEPTELWARFQATVDPVRAYAGQVAGPLGATSFGLVAIAVLILSYARAVSWHLVIAYYVPLMAMAVLAQRPVTVYLLDAPALLLVGMIAADPRRLPRAAAWRMALGAGGGAIAAALLMTGAGVQAFGLGIAAVTGLVTVFQYFGLAGAPGAVERRTEARRDLEEAAAGVEVETLEPAQRRSSALQLVALAVFMPAGLVLVWRDGSLPRPQRAALVTMGAALYLAVIAGSLAWLWFLRLPA